VLPPVRDRYYRRQKDLPGLNACSGTPTSAPRRVTSTALTALSDDWERSERSLESFAPDEQDDESPNTDSHFDRRCGSRPWQRPHLWYGTRPGMRRILRKTSGLSPHRPRTMGFRFRPWRNQSSHLDLVANGESGDRTFVRAAVVACPGAKLWSFPRPTADIRGTLWCDDVLAQL